MYHLLRVRRGPGPDDDEPVRGARLHGMGGEGWEAREEGIRRRVQGGLCTKRSQQGRDAKGTCA